jgi:hypothetical protein
MSQKSIGDFRQVLDAGIHFAGHGTVIGGMSDLWMSPEDPVFFFHHGQVDRLWSIWQEQDLAARMNQTSDTQTWDNGKTNHFSRRVALFLTVCYSSRIAQCDHLRHFGLWGNW